MRNDPGLSAVRAVRSAISSEFDNDPGKLVAHYVEMQSRLRGKVIIQGSEESSLARAHRPRQGADVGDEPDGLPR